MCFTCLYCLNANDFCFSLISRAHLQDYIEDIMQRIQDLLVLNTPDNNGIKCYLSSVDQLFIYETASVLVVHSQFSPEVSPITFPNNNPSIYIFTHISCASLLRSITSSGQK